MKVWELALEKLRPKSAMKHYVDMLTMFKVNKKRHVHQNYSCFFNVNFERSILRQVSIFCKVFQCNHLYLRILG